MPQLVKGVKCVFGWVVLSSSGEVRIRLYEEASLHLEIKVFST